MSKQKKRSYSSSTRQAQAAKTKARILAAAKKLFTEEGFEFVTIEKLAQCAEVSAPTIYALFQSKRGVLRALLDEALPSEKRLEILDQGAGKSPSERLKIAARLTRQMYDAERALMDIFRSAALLTPEFKELEKEREERRYLRQEKSMRELDELDALFKGLELKKARDILWAFTGRDMYRMFVIERDWTPDEYEKWLGELLIKTLIRKS